MSSSATVFDTDCVLMLHCDGTNASTTFTDSSFSSVKTVTAAGDAQISTAQSKFGGASGLFDGTGDYLTAPDSADWDLGTGDFTIDFWYRPAVSTSGVAYVFFDRNNNGVLQLRRHTSDILRLVVLATNVNFTTWTPSINTWYHVAVTRAGTSVYCFVDGTQNGSTGSNSGNIQGTTGIAVGAQENGNLPVNGWIDEFRLVKGTAVWTANFTPPTAAYKRVSSSVQKMMLMGVA